MIDENIMKNLYSGIEKPKDCLCHKRELYIDKAKKHDELFVKVKVIHINHDCTVESDSLKSL